MLPTSEQLVESIRGNPYFRRLAERQDEYMKAPCGHIFHIPCLLNWMEVKHDCPSCRFALPTV